MENYIVINGKKAELTEEQLKALGIEVEKDDPFERVECGDKDYYYYYISEAGDIEDTFDISSNFDNRVYSIANYCTDKTLMEQRALHETLNRLLWRYSMQHGGDEMCDTSDKYCIHYYADNKKYGVLAQRGWIYYLGELYFNSKEIANNAIEEIVKPFMEQHPEFVW